MQYDEVNIAQSAHQHFIVARLLTKPLNDVLYVYSAQVCLTFNANDFVILTFSI